MIEETLTRPIIATARLVLRPPVAEDAPRLAELANDFEVAGMTTTIPHPYTLADAEAFIGRARSAEPAKEALFAIELSGEGVIGTLGLDPDGTLAHEVGYWIGRSYWGRGYVTEALIAGLGWARADWGRRCVTARHFIDNPASAAVLAKAGFLYTGRQETRFCVARAQPVLSRWMVWLA
ncbi:MAG TPA: GNAT family N-acetyltransferase [Caulobacteraceae bacterium]|nr:GNAT family N-acetyltransferase [Caulobacteraceae bacterium]